MPRLHLKRRILLLTTLVAAFLLVINLTYRGLETGEVVKVPPPMGHRDMVIDSMTLPSAEGANGPAPAAPPSGNSRNRQQLQQEHQQQNYRQQKRGDGESALIDDYELANLPKLWFMKDGRVRPETAALDRATNRRKMPLLPHEDEGDRIVQQLMFVPHDHRSDGERKNATVKLKKILLYNGIGNWKPLHIGRETFQLDKCPVDTCEVTIDRSDAGVADAILFRDHVSPNPIDSTARPPWQVWILYLLECPYHTQTFNFKNTFNWTATYRHDSDIVAPYEKFVPYDLKGRVRLSMPRNYALNKTKKVAWFVSNCAAQNGRMEYAEKLSKYIDVDIYGACGKNQCPRSSATKCFELLNRDYKFYLSFENSNCKDYITEKFFVNGLGNDILPIVMGARKEDYQRAAPFHSYLHVEDFAGPKELAEYLHLLDRNDTLYNEYFRWKGTGEFVNTYFWCRMCAVLHDQPTPKVYEDMNTWWRGPGTCINRRWDAPSG